MMGLESPLLRLQVCVLYDGMSSLMHDGTSSRMHDGVSSLMDDCASCLMHDIAGSRAHPCESRPREMREQLQHACMQGSRAVQSASHCSECMRVCCCSAECMPARAG
jgi:hypothetical protein